MFMGLCMGSLIIEVAMFLAGVWAMVTSRLSPLLFGGGRYRIEGPQVRLLGLLLAAIFPLDMAVNALITTNWGRDSMVSACYYYLEIVLLLAAVLFVNAQVRRIRQPIPPPGGNAGTPPAKP